MERKLSTQERIDLQTRHKKERDGRVRDRIKAVLAHDDGYSYSEISRLLLLDDETVRRHIKSYFYQHKLAPENGGSSSYLTVEESRHLKTHLTEKLYLHVKAICAYVQTQMGKSYSVSGMTKWLQANGFRYKKPHGVPAKADKEKQAEFIAHYEALKSSLGPDEAVFFADCTHPQHQTRLAYGWIPAGIRRAKPMTACQKRVNLIGALNLDNHEIEYRQVDWVNAESVKIFLQQ